MNHLSDKTLQQWQAKHSDLNVVKKLKSGKEADVYLVEIGTLMRALKVYDSAAALKTRQQYTEGKWVREKSLRKALSQKTKVGQSLQQRLWTKREFYLLQKLRQQGAIVPEVFEQTDDAILMQYLGDREQAAPRLIDINLNDILQQNAYKSINDSIEIFLKNGIVHGDLSAYNILWWQDMPWIIDFPQAIDIRHNPNWQELYQRDLTNIKDYFTHD
jgi:RIO kinase 1